jgi:chemotaxis protein CheX
LIGGAREVFETMIYMAVEECNDNYETIEEPALLSSITFQGPYEGCLGFCCGVGTAKIIANNMLGTQGCDDLSDEQVRDAMGEIANMVLGSVKALLLDAIGDVKVSIPTVVSGLDLHNSIGEGAESIEMSISLDDAMATLMLFYKEAA